MKKIFSFFKKRKKILLIIVLLVAGLSIIAFSQYKGSLEKKLYKTAKTEMLSLLKTPSVAEFSKEAEFRKYVLRNDPDNILNICGKEVPLHEKLSDEYLSDDYQKYYEVEFWVDAQNSFGAVVRESYTCIVDIKGNVTCETTETSETLKRVVCS